MFEEITQRDSEKGIRTTLVDLGSDTMIKYKNLYIKYIKSGTRRERRERERAKLRYGLHCVRLNYRRVLQMPLFIERL